jgi:hypothetical protein
MSAVPQRNNLLHFSTKKQNRKSLGRREFTSRQGTIPPFRSARKFITTRYYILDMLGLSVCFLNSRTTQMPMRPRRGAEGTITIPIFYGLVVLCSAGINN